MKQACRLLALGLLAAALTGCGSSEATVTQSEEEMFRNRKPVDMSQIPPDAFKSKGPEFIGEPSGATNPSGSQPPPGVVKGK
ncbi:MAG: hypothetical protein ACO1SV_18295 [Fimbriimonas sp.]